MPVRKVKGGYKWGSRGKLYGSKAKAAKQGRADQGEPESSGEEVKLVEPVWLVTYGVSNVRAPAGWIVVER